MKPGSAVGQTATALERLEATQLVLAETSREVSTAIRERDAAREQLVTCRERNAAIAVQLDQYRDERDRYRAALERIRELTERGSHGDCRKIACAALEATP